MDFDCCCLTNSKNEPIKIVDVIIPSGNLKVDYSLNFTSMVDVSKINTANVWIEVDDFKYNFENVNFNLDSNVKNNLIIDPLPKVEILPENCIIVGGKLINLDNEFPWNKKYYLELKEQEDRALLELKKEEENKPIDNSITIKSNHQHLYINSFNCNFDMPKTLSLWAMIDTVDGYVGIIKDYTNNETNKVSEGCYIKMSHL